MRQQLELAFEFKSDLLDTTDWGKRQLVNFDDGMFDRSNNSGVIDAKTNGSALEEKSSFKTVGVSFFSKLD